MHEMADLEGDLMNDLEFVVPEADECGGQEPLVEGCVEPYVGLEFSNQKMTYDFYNTYGYITGFSIRTNTLYKNVKGVVTSIRLVCSKQGFAKGKNVKGVATHGVGQPKPLEAGAFFIVFT